MLMAVLFRDDLVIAAAPACDQYPMGNHYWTEMHPIGLPEFLFDVASGEDLQTSYVSVSHPALRNRLIKASIDDQIDLDDLTRDLQMSARPAYLDRSAA